MILPRIDEGKRHGKTALVQLRHATDPESAERHAVKRYRSEKAQDGDFWSYATITLKSVNPDFKPIILTGSEERQV